MSTTSEREKIRLSLDVSPELYYLTQVATLQRVHEEVLE